MGSRGTKNVVSTLTRRYIHTIRELCIYNVKSSMKEYVGCVVAMNNVYKGVMLKKTFKIGLYYRLELLFGDSLKGMILLHKSELQQ